mmetsp:Transcript_10842/g.31543  ORF Transcript_10842/g.31543 Transcript_10842/m.31543 type:complete len:342 (-) Transcript_10842:61-1086(-)
MKSLKPNAISSLFVTVVIAMIASRRTASSFVRLAATTTTRRAAPTVSRASGHSIASYYTTGNSFRTETQQQETQRRTFFGQVASMFSGGDTPAPEDVTPEYLLEYFGGEHLQGNAIANAMHALYEADAVCFDVDSTVINEEGIDVLADFLGKGEEVAKLTAAAMEGGMKFEDALKARLDLLEPSRKQILDCLEAHPLELTPGLQTLVETLHSKNVDVFLVSGGFRIMIEPLAEILKIPIANIVANTINFEYGSEGKYAGFDPNEPTSQDMGKPKALEQLKEKFSYENMVMVGDGATDAQAKPPAKAFVGFGGVVERPAVKDQADWFVKDFADMTKVVAMRQ